MAVSAVSCWPRLDERRTQLLAPGGLMILSTPNRTALSKLLLVEAAERVGAVPRGTHDWDQFLKPEELTRLIEVAGREVIDRTRQLTLARDAAEHANRAIEAVGKMAKSSLALQATLVCVSPEPIFYGNYTVATIEKIGEDQKRQQDDILNKAHTLARSQGIAALANAFHDEAFIQREVDLITKGRHDPCVGIRAVPVGEAMMACVLADAMLRHRGQTGR